MLQRSLFNTLFLMAILFTIPVLCFPEINQTRAEKLMNDPYDKESFDFIVDVHPQALAFYIAERTIERIRCHQEIPVLISQIDRVFDYYNCHNLSHLSIIFEFIAQRMIAIITARENYSILSGVNRKNYFYFFRQLPSLLKSEILKQHLGNHLPAFTFMYNEATDHEEFLKKIAVNSIKNIPMHILVHDIEVPARIFADIDPVNNSIVAVTFENCELLPQVFNDMAERLPHLVELVINQSDISFPYSVSHYFFSLARFSINDSQIFNKYPINLRPALLRISGICQDDASQKNGFIVKNTTENLFSITDDLFDPVVGGQRIR